MDSYLLAYTNELSKIRTSSIRSILKNLFNPDSTSNAVILSKLEEKLTGSTNLSETLSVLAD